MTILATWYTPAMKSIVPLLRGCWHDLLDFALPNACSACGLHVEGSAWLCTTCDDRLHDLRRMPSCERCASPLPDPRGPCGRCRGKGIRPFDRIARLSTFESTTRDLVHAIKYGRRWAMVNLVATMLGEQPRVDAILREADVLVPIPLHWTRRFGRGFNQSELIARALAKPGTLPIANALRRTRATPTQTGIHSRAKRRRNLHGAFEATDPRRLHGRRIVLVDDVMTSGATLQAAARAIRRACRPAGLDAVVIATANPLKSDLVAV